MELCFRIHRYVLLIHDASLLIGLPVSLQATSDSSASSNQLKRSICKSPAALGALSAFLEAAADEAVGLANQLAPPSSVIPGGVPLSPLGSGLLQTDMSSSSVGGGRSGSMSKSSQRVGRALR